MCWMATTSASGSVPTLVFRRVGEVAALMAESGVIVIACFISPFERGRLQARQAAGTGRFFEIYLDTPLAVCEKRDPKGLYRKARDGVIAEFTGVSSPYEPPRAPELVLPTQSCSVDTSVDRVLQCLEQAGVLSP